MTILWSLGCFFREKIGTPRVIAGASGLIPGFPERRDEKSRTNHAVRLHPVRIRRGYLPQPQAQDWTSKV